MSERQNQREKETDTQRDRQRRMEYRKPHSVNSYLSSWSKSAVKTEGNNRSE